jgi:hypothetical protein
MTVVDPSSLTTLLESSSVGSWSDLDLEFGSASPRAASSEEPESPPQAATNIAASTLAPRPNKAFVVLIGLS